MLQYNWFNSKPSAKIKDFSLLIFSAEDKYKLNITDDVTLFT